MLELLFVTEDFDFVQVGMMLSKAFAKAYPLVEHP